MRQSSTFVVSMTLPAIGLVALVAGCTSDREKNSKPWEFNNTTANNTTANNTTANNTTANNTTSPACEGPGFECVPACGGDYFMGSECVNGQWQCPTEDGPWVPIDTCPPGSCFGLPYPGEICDNGFQCRPDLTGALAACDEIMCITCEGFDPDLHDDPTCECECSDGEVHCQRPQNCEVTSTSDLPGVQIRLLGDVCSWTADQLAAGVTIGYEVIVDAALAPPVVINTRQDAGGCGLPGPDGLITFFRISSDVGDNYCVCDTGLCAPNMDPSNLVGGTHSRDFEWFGNNWNGPSDTGNPMGPPFASSSATVAVSAVGTTPDGAQFRVATEMNVTIER